MTNNTGIAQTKTAGGPMRPAPVAASLHDVRAEHAYKQALHRHMEGMETKEIDFFVNAGRLRLLGTLIGHEIKKKGARVLNVACGPFALEFYLQPRDAKITSFDREPRMAGLHRDLVDAGLIAPSEFIVEDVNTFDAAGQFDCVIVNDLFYSKYVDFYALADKYVALVKPGGLLYFDIQDERAGPIWRAFGKDGRFRRYDLGDVARTLETRGMKIETTLPVLGIKGGVDRTIRKGLWHAAGLANSHVFVARKAVL